MELVRNFLFHNDTIRSATFCARCSNILYGKIEPRWGPEGRQTAFFDHHHSFRSLEAAASDGCRICLAFLGRIAVDEVERLIEIKDGLFTSASLEKGSHHGFPECFDLTIYVPPKRLSDKVTGKRRRLSSTTIFQPVTGKHNPLT